MAAVGELWSGRRGRGVESARFTTALPGMVGLSSIGLLVVCVWPVPVSVVFPVGRLEEEEGEEEV